MKRAFLFDVDGTLTDPLKKMDSNFVYFFLDWIKNKDVFLVAGSDLEKVTKQIPSSVISRCKGVFSSMGNQLNINGNIIYKNNWKPPVKLLSELLTWHNKSPYKNKKKKYLEKRIGMLNFSIAGRESSIKERERYYKWDKVYGERESIVEDLSKKFPKVDFRIGGMISIDIQPKGFNKSLATRWVRGNEGYKMVYFGDKIHEGGNDYDAILDLKENKDGEYHKIKSPEETKKILIDSYEKQ